MNIDSLPKFSDRILLRDISPVFSALEGDTGAPAYVVVRRAIEEDNLKIAELAASHEIAYPQTGMVERISANEREMRKHQVYLTLQEAGNLTRGDMPAFPVQPTHDMPFEAFEWVWLALPDQVTTAIIEAVLVANPAWR